MLPQVENKAERIKKVEDGKYKKGPLSHSIGKNKINKISRSVRRQTVEGKKVAKAVIFALGQLISATFFPATFSSFKVYWYH